MPPRKKPSRNRSKLRIWIWRVSLLGISIAAALLILVYNVPLEAQWLTEKLRTQVELATHAKLEFESAGFFLGQLKCVVRRPMLLADAEQAAPIVSAERVSIQLNPFALVGLSRKIIGTITIESPSPLEFIYDEHGLQLAPPLRSLLERIQAENQVRTGERVPPIQAVEIRDASVRLIRKETAVIALPSRPRGKEFSPTSVTLSLTNLRVRAADEKRYDGRAEGIVELGHASTPFQMSLSILGSDDLRAELIMPQLAVQNVLIPMPPLRATAEQVSLNLRVLREEQELRCFGGATAQTLYVSLPTRKLQFSDQALDFSWALRLTQSSKEIEIERLNLQSPNAAVELSGRIGLSPLAYDLGVRFERFGGSWAQILAAFASEQHASFDLPPDGLRGQIAFAGTPERIHSLLGTVRVTSATVALDGLRDPLREVGGELSFEPQRVVLRQLAASLKESTIRAEGDFQGDLLTSRSGAVRLNWHLKSSLADLASVARTVPPLRRGLFLDELTLIDGLLESEGDYEQVVDLSDPKLTQPPRLRGNMQCRQVAVSHPRLPAPIREVNGSVTFENETLRINRLQGRLDHNHFDIEGMISGSSGFWENAVATGTATVKLELAELLGYFSRYSQRPLPASNVTGSAEARLRFAIPLTDIPKSSFSVEGTVANAGFSLRNDVVDADIRRANAQLRYQSATGNLEISKVAAEVNGTLLTGDLSADAKQVTIAARSSFDLETLMRISPKIARWYELAGPAQGDVRIQLMSPSAVQATPSNSLRPVASLMELPHRISSAFQDGTFQLKGTVTLGNNEQGATIRHRSMPPARTLPYGLSVPRAELANFRGTGILDGITLLVPEAQPATCDMADTKNCRVSGTITFVPGNLPKIVFRAETDGEAKLDTWLTGWGMEAPRGGPPPQGHRHFELEGTFSANRVTYKGLQAGRGTGVVAYFYTQGEPERRTEFRRVRIEGFGGIMAGEGYIISRKDDPANFPRWGAQVNLEHVQIPPVMRWVFTDPRTVNGTITARISLEGVRADSSRLSGSGSATLYEVEVGRLPFILRLFQFLNLTQMRRGFFEKSVYNSKPNTEFRIKDGVLTCDHVALETEGLLLELHGKYFLQNHSIDSIVRLNIFESTLLGGLPIVDEIARFADRTLGRWIMAFRVSGPAANPSIQPVPLPMVQGILPPRPE